MSPSAVWIAGIYILEDLGDILMYYVVLVQIVHKLSKEIIL